MLSAAPEAGRAPPAPGSFPPGVGTLGGALRADCGRPEEDQTP